MGPLLVINAVVTPQSCTHIHASCHVLWQLVRCFAISCEALIVAQLPQKLARLRSDTQAHWRTVTAVNTRAGMPMTHSLKKTKEYNVFDSFSARARQLLQSALSFFLSCKKKCETYTTRPIILFFTGSTIFCLLLSCIPATLQQHISCLFSSV